MAAAAAHEADEHGELGWYPGAEVDEAHCSHAVHDDRSGDRLMHTDRIRIATKCGSYTRGEQRYGESSSREACTRLMLGLGGARVARATKLGRGGGSSRNPLSPEESAASIVWRSPAPCRPPNQSRQQDGIMDGASYERIDAHLLKSQLLAGHLVGSHSIAREPA